VFQVTRPRFLPQRKKERKMGEVVDLISDDEEPSPAPSTARARNSAAKPVVVLDDEENEAHTESGKEAETDASGREQRRASTAQEKEQHSESSRAGAQGQESHAPAARARAEPRGDECSSSFFHFVGAPVPDLPMRIALDEGTEYTVGREMVEGSMTSFIHLDSPAQPNMISRQHALISWNADSWFVQDLGSTNGLLLNGRKVSSAALRDGVFLF